MGSSEREREIDHFSFYCIASNDKMKDVLKRTISEARAAVSKVRVFHCSIIACGYIQLYSEATVKPLPFQL